MKKASEKYVIYYRVSTKRQGESGLGLEAQEAYVQHYYGDKNIIASFTDVRSGKTIAKRPELLKALDLCKNERAVLVVAKIDRLSRDTEQALSIYRDLDGRLESCDIPNLDKFTLTLFMAIADRERELIGIRTKQALEQKRAKMGEWRKPGVSVEKKRAAVAAAAAVNVENAVDEVNNSRAVKLALRLRKEGLTLAAIAKELNDSQFRTSTRNTNTKNEKYKGNKLFSPTQVKRLLDRAGNAKS